MGRVPADLDADYHQIMTIWCKWEWIEHEVEKRENVNDLLDWSREQRKFKRDTNELQFWLRFKIMFS
jgi:site-specific recombinase